MAIRNFKSSSVKTGTSRSTIWDQVSFPSLTVDYLVVAGGGGGGRGDSVNSAGGAGGGAGGFRTVTNSSFALNTAFTVTIGAGGVGSTSISSKGSNGVDSVFNSTTSTGGGSSGPHICDGGGGDGGVGGGGGGASHYNPGIPVSKSSGFGGGQTWTIV